MSLHLAGERRCRAAPCAFNRFKESTLRPPLSTRPPVQIHSPMGVAQLSSQVSSQCAGTCDCGRGGEQGPCLRGSARPFSTISPVRARQLLRRLLASGPSPETSRYSNASPRQKKLSYSLGMTEHQRLRRGTRGRDLATRRLSMKRFGHPAAQHEEIWPPKTKTLDSPAAPAQRWRSARGRCRRQCRAPRCRAWRPAAPRAGGAA